MAADSVLPERLQELRDSIRKMKEVGGDIECTYYKHIDALEAELHVQGEENAELKRRLAQTELKNHATMQDGRGKPVLVNYQDGGER